jgi:hypothetical protein
MARKKAVKAGVPAPEHLCPEAQARWVEYMADYEFDPAQLHLLDAALTMFSRAVQAREEIEANMGRVTCVDRFGQSKTFPPVEVERQCLDLYAKLLDKLGLDLEPLHDGPGRPAGS